MQVEGWLLSLSDDSFVDDKTKEVVGYISYQISADGSVIEGTADRGIRECLNGSAKKVADGVPVYVTADIEPRQASGRTYKLRLRSLVAH